MGIRKSQGKNKKSKKPAAAARVGRDSARKRAARTRQPRPGAR